MTAQIINVQLELKEDQEPYQFLEHAGTYHALQHFFEDIGYKVKNIEAELL